MAKHVCGSCRFFKEAREGKQGWCTHPERQESSAVRILVRAAELRCRDDWGHDKWEAQTESDEVLDIVMNDASAHRIPATERRYTPPIERAVPEPAEPAALSASPLMPVIDFGEPDEAPELARSVSSDLNSKLLREARAQFQARQKNKRYAVARQQDDEPEALVISNQFIPPSREMPHPTSNRRGNSVFEFEGRGNDEAFNAIPEIEECRELPRTQRVDVVHSSQAGPSTGGTREESRHAAEARRHDDFGAAMPESAQSFAPPEIDPWIESKTSADFDPYPVDPVSDRNVEPEIDLDNWEVARQTARPAEVAGIWADIPRCCLTCRDFRPAGNGERGWCTNQWAFKHRRMVDAHDRPCETSIGHWWIPGDAAWQGEFDISALGQPTPLMDKWFSRSVADEAADVPAERRRRKTGSW